MTANLGRLLIVAGLLLAAAGALLLLADRLPLKLGRLPGDIVYKGKNATIFFPIATSVLLSLLLSLAMWILNRRR